MFVFNEECKVTPCEPGVERKILSWSEELMMCEIRFKEGAVGNTHTHPHLQITYIAEGEFDFTIGEETRRVKKGDSVYMPSGISHGVKCVKTGVLVDVFNPKRDEFLA